MEAKIAPDSRAGGARGRLAALAGNAVGHGDGCDAPRLRAHNAARTTLPRLDRRVQQELRHLCTCSRYSSYGCSYRWQCDTMIACLY